jgi:hypothetical protein
MKCAHARIAPVAVALLAVWTTGLAVAGPNPLPTDSHAFGKGYAELAADWLEWAVSIPAAVNPLTDPNGRDVGIGQSGKVWFLAGTATSDSVVRTVSVPAGKAVFFPIINYYWVNAPEYGDNPWSAAQEAFSRGLIAAVVDAAQNVALEFDGVGVANVNRLRISGDLGACTIPDDNVVVPGLPFAPGPHPCFADGYWALLPPLSAGSHTIHFAGSLPIVGFSLDVTYHILARH